MQRRVLAALLSWDLRAADKLTMQVFTRLSVNVRIAMLDDAMAENWYGQVAAASRAHPQGRVQPPQSLRRRVCSMERDGSGENTTWNRGRGTVARCDIETLAWLSWQAMVWQSRTQLDVGVLRPRGAPVARGLRT